MTLKHLTRLYIVWLQVVILAQNCCRPVKWPLKKTAGRTEFRWTFVSFWAIWGHYGPFLDETSKFHVPKWPWMATSISRTAQLSFKKQKSCEVWKMLAHLKNRFLSSFLKIYWWGFCVQRAWWDVNYIFFQCNWELCIEILHSISAKMTMYWHWRQAMVENEDTISLPSPYCITRLTHPG